VERYGLDSSGLGEGPMAGCCDHGNEPDRLLASQEGLCSTGLVIRWVHSEMRICRFFHYAFIWFAFCKERITTPVFKTASIWYRDENDDQLRACVTTPFRTNSFRFESRGMNTWPSANCRRQHRGGITTALWHRSVILIVSQRRP
jgi:hypothetical protein